MLPSSRTQACQKETATEQQPVPTPSAPEPLPQSKAFELAPEQQTLVDRWWQEYSSTDGQGRMQMVVETLDLTSPDDDWFEALFPEAITELESELSKQEYVAFLTQMRDENAGVLVMALQ